SVQQEIIFGSVMTLDGPDGYIGLGGDLNHRDSVVRPRSQQPDQGRLCCAPLSPPQVGDSAPQPPPLPRLDPDGHRVEVPATPPLHVAEPLALVLVHNVWAVAAVNGDAFAARHVAAD